MKIHVTKGLDIPIAGKPEGSPQPLSPPDLLALNLDSFEELKFKVHVKINDQVKIGTPLVENKQDPGVMFVSPAAGTVKEIRRGFKRRLLAIVIERDPEEKFEEQKGLVASASRDDALAFLQRAGGFPHIRMRPFNLLARPNSVPRDIFVQAGETLPFLPHPEIQIEGHEELFQVGLDMLSKLTTGKVHLVYDEKTKKKAFLDAQNVERHSFSGPHPASSPSLHIHRIAPIKNGHDTVWTLTALDVVVIGSLIKNGRYFIDRILSVAGNGIIKEARGFFRGRVGFPISSLTQNRVIDEPVRLISGDPLVGHKTDNEDFLGFYHTALSALPENYKRESFHFLRLGTNKYSHTRTYFSGHVKPPKEGYTFTTNQHGEERAFIDGAIYDKVMPMKIPTMFLIKAILSDDFEMAEALGILEVTPEDFALPTFICPSKIEMVQIVKEGLSRLSKEMGY